MPAFACDATLCPDKSYVVLSSCPVENLKFENEKILSGEVLTSIFGEKNQIILKPQKIGKTQMTLNGDVYKIEVSREQKEEFNIEKLVIDEIDTPFDMFFDAVNDEKGGVK